MASKTKKSSPKSSDDAVLEAPLQEKENRTLEEKVDELSKKLDRLIELVIDQNQPLDFSKLIR